MKCQAADDGVHILAEVWVWGPQIMYICGIPCALDTPDPVAGGAGPAPVQQIEIDDLPVPQTYELCL